MNDGIGLRLSRCLPSRSVPTYHQLLIRAVDGDGGGEALLRNRLFVIHSHIIKANSPHCMAHSDIGRCVWVD